MSGRVRKKIKIFVMICLVMLIIRPAGVMAWPFAPAEMTMAVGSMSNLFGGLPQNPAFAQFIQNNKRNLGSLEDIQTHVFQLKSCLSGFRDSIVRNSLNRDIFRESSGTIHTAARGIEKSFLEFSRIDFFRDPRNHPQYEQEIKIIITHLEEADRSHRGDIMGDLEDGIKDGIYIADIGFLLDGLLVNLRSLDMALMNLKNIMERR